MNKFYYALIKKQKDTIKIFDVRLFDSIIELKKAYPSLKIIGDASKNFPLKEGDYGIQVFFKTP